MVRLRTLILLSGAALIVAAGSPHSLAAAVGGLWEVGLNAEGKDAKRMCLPDPTVLAQWEHRAERCTRVVVSDIGTSAKFHYTCVSGGFGVCLHASCPPRRRLSARLSWRLPYGA